MIVLGVAGLLSLTCLAQNDASAQEKKPAAPQTPASALKKFYHLSFVVQELDNERVINSRSYSMIMSEMGQSSIRAGEKDRIPQPQEQTLNGNRSMWASISTVADCKPRLMAFL
jgi:hypothetical protein